MKLFKLRVLVVLSLLAIVSFGCTGDRGRSGASDKPRYAFITNGVFTFWIHAKVGVHDAAKELGADYDFVMPSSITDQTRKLEDVLIRGVDGIAISPISADNQVGALNKAAEETNLITHDSDAPKSNRLAYIGMDNYQAGLLVGELMRKALPDGGRIALFIGNMDQDNSALRRQGTVDAFLGRKQDKSRRDDYTKEHKSEDGKYVVLGTFTDGGDAGDAKAKVEDTLTRTPDIEGLVGLFEHNPPAIIEALDRANKLGKVKVVGFDENEATLQGIKNGTVLGTVVQDPYEYGFRSIMVLAKLHAGKKLESDYVDVPPRMIVKENVEEFWKLTKDRLKQGNEL